MIKLKKSSFKTVIITRKRAVFALSAAAAAISLLCTIAKAAEGGLGRETAVPEELYTEIIAVQLNDEAGGGELLKRAARLILGFDPESCETILYSGMPQLYALEASEETPPPEVAEAEQEPIQPQSETVPEQEYGIEEIHASQRVMVSNKTNLAIDPEALAAEPLCYSLDGSGVQLLIVHTHTTESFTEEGKNKYTASESDRSTDETKNIVAVGNAMQAVFEAEGISSVHDTTVHDYPSFSGAYTRSLATVKASLEQNPGIKVILDVHRDGLVREDGTKLKVAADINGTKAAQCMIVVGSNANLQHDRWTENLKLACKIQKKANELFPGLMRPILLREERFNQQISPGAIIIEVGANGNTLAEAERGGEYAARAICETLKNG